MGKSAKGSVGPATSDCGPVTSGYGPLVDPEHALPPDRDTTPPMSRPAHGVDEAERDLRRYLETSTAGASRSGTEVVGHLCRQGHSEAAARWALHSMLARGELALEPAAPDGRGGGVAICNGGWHNHKNIAVRPTDRLFEPGVLPPETPADGREAEHVCLVTLHQAAAMVNRVKKTLERYKKDDSTMPQPRVSGGGGKPDEWAWAELRPWLEKTFERPLPERFPADKLRPT